MALSTKLGSAQHEAFDCDIYRKQIDKRRLRLGEVGFASLLRMHLDLRSWPISGCFGCWSSPSSRAEVNR